MNFLRKDPTRGQWVLVRPKVDAAPATGECPFCPGSESRTPPEIAAYRKEGSPPDGPGWTVRVIPEIDPYFQVEARVVREGVGLYDKVSSRGATELIIESPSHDVTPAAMDEAQWEEVLWMYRDRLRDLKKDQAIRDILITRRHRKPGSHIQHPYSRVNAVPIIFDDVRRKLRECREYYEYKRRCVFCDIIRQEITDEARLVRLTPHFAVVVPYAARTAYEAWILPRRHACAFEQVFDPETAVDLAGLLRGYFRTLASAQDDPGFEMTLYTAPNQSVKVLPTEWSTLADDYHWHIEVTPTPERLGHIGGIHINETPPEDAARRLREAWA
jgi:UDPglucose--hexose-1-phosphate uridylyltransferase